MTTTSNIASWVTDRAATDPGLPAIKQGDTVLSYGDLDAASARFATVLADHGVRAGDRVALTMPNVAYFPVVYYAILRLGAIVVPMNPLLKAGEISYTWTDCGAKVAVVFPLFAEEAAKAADVTGTDVIVTTPGELEAQLAGTEPFPDLAERAAEDTAVILYTSGTTGQPRARSSPTPTCPATSGPRSRPCCRWVRVTWSSAGCRSSTPSVRPWVSTRRWPAGPA